MKRALEASPTIFSSPLVKPPPFLVYTIGTIKNERWTTMASKKTIRKHVKIPRMPENMKGVPQQTAVWDCFKVQCARVGKTTDLVLRRAAAKIPVSSGDPADVMQALVEAGREAGIDPVLLDIVENTGWTLSGNTVQYLSEDDLEEWKEAILEGRRTRGHKSMRVR